jgi:hypothetical protein
VCAARLVSGCGLGTWLEDQFTADVAFTEDVPVDEKGNKTRTKKLPGDLPTFDLLRDCMPADLDENRKCAKPTMLVIGAKSGVDQATHRNRFQDYLIWRSEQQCERHKAGIMSTQAGVNFGLSTLTTGAAATAAIVTAPASSILGAVGALFSGTRSHFNENFFRQMLAPGVVREINKSRGAQLGIIMSKRGVPATERPALMTMAKAGTTTQTEVPSKTVMMADYTLEEALGDVERYHQLCSFTAGLSALIEPGEKFEDTAVGLKQRIDALRQMQTDNDTQAKKWEGANASDEEKLAAKRLRETNTDISKQIMILQHRMLTASLIVGGKSTSG